MNKKKPKVIAYNKISQDLMLKLKDRCDPTYVEKGIIESNPQSVINLSAVEGLIGSGLKVDKKLLDQTPSLRVVSNISVGYDNLDMDELNKRKILATNTPDVLTDSVADAIFGLLLTTARRISELDRYVKKGLWIESIGQDLFGIDVHHKTLGIIGMGRIGEAIAKRAHAGFGMNIIYHNRHRKHELESLYSARYCSLDDLLKNSDYVCVMAPLNSETKNLISKRELELMKDTAILTVGSRGGIVNEGDLVTALQEGKLCAAGFDVYKEEPINPDLPLLKLKNVVTLPHIGSATAETRESMALLAVENLLDGLSGIEPSCLINKKVLDKNYKWEGDR